MCQFEMVCLTINRKHHLIKVQECWIDMKYAALFSVLKSAKDFFVLIKMILVLCAQV